MKPKDIQLIGNELCIIWDDSSESYFSAEFLRINSPSAANIGEKDIFGTQYGGDGPKQFPESPSKAGTFKAITPSARGSATATAAGYIAGIS